MKRGYWNDSHLFLVSMGRRSLCIRNPKHLPLYFQVILGLEANSKRPIIKRSEIKMTEMLASSNSFSPFPRRQLSSSRRKHNILKGSKILKPRCGRKRKHKQKYEETAEPGIVRSSFGHERLRRRLGVAMKRLLMRESWILRHFNAVLSELLYGRNNEQCALFLFFSPN